ncbi:hypothetical protein K2X85_04685 [bacterium]|nr:hypothetical protein [bacterium]
MVETPSTTKPTVSKKDASIQTVSFALIAAVAAAVFLVWLVTLCRIMPEWTVMLLASISIFGIGWSLTPPIVLALLATILADSPGHWLGVLPSFGRQLSFAELCLSATFIIYASLTYRFQRARIDVKRSSRSGSMASAQQDLGEWLIIVTSGFVLATIARWVLPLLYMGRAWAPSIQLVPGVAGLLVALVLIGLASWLWNALVRAVGREGMSSAQARLILNQAAQEEMGSEMTLIARKIGQENHQEEGLRPIKM